MDKRMKGIFNELVSGVELGGFCSIEEDGRGKRDFDEGWFKGAMFMLEILVNNFVGKDEYMRSCLDKLYEKFDAERGGD